MHTTITIKLTEAQEELLDRYLDCYDCHAGTECVQECEAVRTRWTPGRLADIDEKFAYHMANYAISWLGDDYTLGERSSVYGFINKMFKVIPDEDAKRKWWREWRR